MGSGTIANFSDQLSVAISQQVVSPLFNTLLNSVTSRGIPSVITAASAVQYMRFNPNSGTSFLASPAAFSSAIIKNIYANPASPETYSLALNPKKYFASVNLRSAVESAPVGNRDVFGPTSEIVFSVLDQMDAQAANKILLDCFSSAGLVKAIADNGVPAGNVTASMSGKIEWDLSLKTATGKTLVRSIFDSILAQLPQEMQDGGEYEARGARTVAYVSTANFATMRSAVDNAGQFNATGGFTHSATSIDPNGAQHSVDQVGVKWNSQYIRYQNLIIVPVVGLPTDTIIVTYMDLSAGAKKIAFDTIDPYKLDNMAFVLGGNFAHNPSLTTDFRGKYTQYMMDIPYTVGRAVFVSQVTPLEAKDLSFYQWAFGMDLMTAILIKEPSKFWAVLPTSLV